MARNGFIVGMPEHIRMVVDWFFENKMFKRKIKPNAVSIIGHSLGGYTALAAAGGLPTSFPHETPDGHELIGLTE
jgi:predicted dienelactone hydrolase